ENGGFYPGWGPGGYFVDTNPFTDNGGIDFDPSNGGDTGGGNTNNDPPHNDSGHDPAPIVISPVLPDDGPEEPEEPHPCDKIAAQIDDPAFQDKMDELEGNTSLHHEAGYSQNNDGSFSPLPAGSTGNSLEIPITPTTVGCMHAHLDDFQADINGDGILDNVQP